MNILFRKFHSSQRTAIYIRQRDTFELIGLRGRAAKACLEAAGWKHGVYHIPDSNGQFKGYRHLIQAVAS